MKRTFILLACMLFLVGALGGALWLLRRPVSPAASAADASAQLPPAQRLCPQPDSAALRSLTVSGPAGDFVILLQDNGLYALEGYDHAPLAPEQLQGLMRFVPRMSGEVVAPRTDDLAQFGLDAPAATLTADFDGGAFSFFIGNAAPGSTARYVRTAHDEAVYLVTGAEKCLQPPLAFLSTSLVQAAPASPLPTRVELGGSVRDAPLRFGLDETGALRMLSHGDYAVNYETIAQPLTELFSLQADAVAAYQPTAEALQQYGLAQPYSTLSFQWQDAATQQAQACTLLASAPQDGMCYVMRADAPVVYAIAQEKLLWLNWQYQDVVTRFLLLPSIKDVAQVEIIAATQQECYTLTPTDGDALRITDQTGTALSYDSFKKLYQCLIGLPAEMLAAQPPAQSAPVLLTIRYHYRDGRPADTVELVDGPTLQCYLRINGKAEFLTKTQYAATILDNVVQLAQGGGIAPLY